MKFLALLLVFVAYVSAQVPVPAPVPVPVPAAVPFVPPFLGGLGGFGLGGFPLGLGLGLGPFGFGGLGLGLGGFGPFGLRRFGLGLGLGFGRGRFFGKRAVDEVSPIDNSTMCQFDQARSVIRCVAEEEFECPCEARLDRIRDLTIRLPRLNMLVDIARADKVEIPVIRVLSHINPTATLVHPKTRQDVLLSIFASPTFTEQGWLIKDQKCYERISGLVTRQGESGIHFRFEREL